MIKTKRFNKIFPGWWIVLAGGFIGWWGHGFHTHGFSALFKPISSELGLSRAVTATAASIGRFEGGIEAPFSGWITDRFGPRWITLSGVFIAGLGLVLMNFVDSLWSFLLVWGVVLGTGINIGLALPIQTAIANWFVKKRGLALSIRLVITGLAGVLVLPLVAWLITILGWRLTCVIGGLVMWFVGLPLLWLSLKQHRPEYYGLLPDGAETGEEVETGRMIDMGERYAAEVEEIEFTLRQVMRTPSYWLLIAAHGMHGFAESAIRIHGIPFLTDWGIDPLKAASIMALMALASIPARFIGGFLADRVRIRHLRFLLGGAYLLQAVGIPLFLLHRTVGMIYIWFICNGFGNGASLALMNPIRARYFGRKAIGSIIGTSTMFLAFGAVIAPIYTGWIYDTTGSYISTFTLFAVLLVSSTIITSFIFPPKSPAETTYISRGV
ncbi:MFS transporter [Chloroflexota bacterium]